MQKNPNLTFIFDRFHNGVKADPGLIIDAKDYESARKVAEKLYPNDTWHCRSYQCVNSDDESD